MSKKPRKSEPRSAVADSDLGDRYNGDLFVDVRLPYRLLYCDAWGKWLWFDGIRWTDRCKPIVQEQCRGVVKMLVDMATDKSLGKAGQDALFREARRCNSRHGQEGMLYFARQHEKVLAYSDAFDTDPWLLNCKNGTVDLRTGQLRCHSPKDLITKLCPVMYDPEATFDTWNQFLSDTSDGNDELGAFLQRAVGYSLCGSTDEDNLFLVHGPAASGKSTFIEAVKAAMGDYAVTTDFDTFLKRRQVGQPRNDIARLRGARLVASIEVDEGRRFAEGVVKALTGGDTVTARHLYKEAFEFVPQFKLWLVANHAPRVSDQDSAMWRRILRVPFEHVVPEGHRDPSMKQVLRNPKEGGPAVLAWAVKGCLDWQERGLDAPPCVVAATSAYREENDPMRDFFEECCVFAPDAWVTVAQLRGEYEDHARDTGIKHTISPQKFNERVEARGGKRVSRRLGERRVRCWEGIGLLRSQPF